jgi:hypothetical protein
MRFRRWFTPAAAALAVGGLGWALWSRRSAIEAFDWGFSWPAIAAAAALFALLPLIQALSFRILLAELGAPVRYLSATVVGARSFLLRYAPTGVMGLAYRLRESGRLGTSPARVATATYARRTRRSRCRRDSCRHHRYRHEEHTDGKRVTRFKIRTEVRHGGPGTGSIVTGRGACAGTAAAGRSRHDPDG